jgi:hypothetical protein
MALLRQLHTNLAGDPAIVLDAAVALAKSKIVSLLKMVSSRSMGQTSSSSSSVFASR